MEIFFLDDVRSGRGCCQDAGVVRTRGRLTRFVFGEILSRREGLHIYHRDKLTAEIFVSQRAFCRADIAAA